MFIQLVESGRKTRRSVAGAAASVVLHTALISLAIAATANARTPRVDPPREAPIIFIAPQPTQMRTTDVRANPVSTVSSHPVAALPRVALIVPVSVPTDLPEPSPISAPLPTGLDNSTNAIPTESSGGSTGTGDSGPLTIYQVDKPVRMLSSNGAPNYLEMLRSRGVEGSVYARFVVTESGRVDMKSFEVLGSTNELFVSSVRSALARARFQPAEASGRKVAQLVEQHFQFRLDQ